MMQRENLYKSQGIIMQRLDTEEQIRLSAKTHLIFVPFQNKKVRLRNSWSFKSCRAFHAVSSGIFWFLSITLNSVQTR